jgi:hypothetical protein
MVVAFADWRLVMLTGRNACFKKKSGTIGVLNRAGRPVTQLALKLRTT